MTPLTDDQIALAEAIDALTLRLPAAQRLPAQAAMLLILAKSLRDANDTPAAASENGHTAPKKHGIKIYTCKHCQDTFSNRSDLIKHKKEAHA